MRESIHRITNKRTGVTCAVTEGPLTLGGAVLHCVWRDGFLLSWHPHRRKALEEMVRSAEKR